MAMLLGLVATQVKLIHLNFSCRLSLEFQAGVTMSPKQTDVLMELMTFGMSFENAISKPVKKGSEERISLLFDPSLLSVY